MSPARRTPAANPVSTVEDQILASINGSNDAPIDDQNENLIRQIFGNVNGASMNDDEMDAILNEATSLVTDQPKAGKGFMIEYHGVAKTGKTFNAMSAAALTLENPNLSPELRVLLEKGVIPLGTPVFVIDTELKAEKLRHKFRNTGKDIHIFPIFYPDSQHGFQYDPTKSMLKMAQILTMIHNKFPDRGTIVIDSMSDITDWIRKYIQYTLVGRRAEGADLGELIRLQPTDWQVRDDIWTYLFKTLQKMKNHIIVTSQEKEDWSFEKDQDGNIIGKTGVFTPRRYKFLPFNVDLEIGLRYTFDSKGDPVGRIAKIITNQFDDPSLNLLHIENPTFVKLIERIVPISHQIEIDMLRNEIEQERQRRVVSNA